MDELHLQFINKDNEVDRLLLMLLTEKEQEDKPNTTNKMFEEYHKLITELQIIDFQRNMTLQNIHINKYVINDLLYRSKKICNQLNFTSHEIKEQFIELIHNIKSIIQQNNLHAPNRLKKNIRDYHTEIENTKLKHYKVIDLLRERNFDLTTLPDEFLPKLRIEFNDFKIKRKDNNLYYEELSEDKKIKTITNVNDKNDTFTYLDTEWDYYIW
jgi:hypothetical protein